MSHNNTKLPMPNKSVWQFRLYVTQVDSDGPFLKISGQRDKHACLMIKNLLESAFDNLEKGIGSVPASAICEGIICVVKYKDVAYYRAQIISTENLSTGLVGVKFIDFGNEDIISLTAIRFLDNYDPRLLKICKLASEYYLSQVMHLSGQWEESQVSILQSLLCFADYPVTVDALTHTIPIISLQYNDTDLSTILVKNELCIPLYIKDQESFINHFTNKKKLLPNWQQFSQNLNFPADPASPMGLKYIPQNSFGPPKLSVNKLDGIPVNSKVPMRQPNEILDSSMQSTTPPPVVEMVIYKSRLLEVNSQHRVFVCYAQQGPDLFGVQLVCDAKKLQDMMYDINTQPLSNLKEPPMIGSLCLGRFSGNHLICRAIVLNLSASQCMLYFVDFGGTDMVSYHDMFVMTEEIAKPNVFSIKFSLSGLKNIGSGPHLNNVFKQIVNGKELTLKVVAPTGPPLIQYAELYLGNKNVLELLMVNMKDQFQFNLLDMLQLGSKHLVLVSYVESCSKFFVRLSNNIDKLDIVMEAVKVHCETSSHPGELPVGMACCARFPEDGNWYRAMIRDSKYYKFRVYYVDYGNEQEVNITDLRTITLDLLTLPAQAIKCALKGLEHQTVEIEKSNQLEMLALEKKLMAHVVGVLSNDTLLVTLVDDSVSPSMDITKIINQASQLRSKAESKIATSVKKESPESFSLAEGSVPDNESFKVVKPPPRETSEEFGQRSGSFRNSDGYNRQYEWDSNSCRYNRREHHCGNRGENRVCNLWEHDGEIGNRGVRRDNLSEWNKSWNPNRVCKDKCESGHRPQRKYRYVPKGDLLDKSFRRNRYKTFGSLLSLCNFSQSEYKKLTDPVPLETPFSEPNIEQGAELEVSVTWIKSPDSFYVQIMSLQTKFLNMMHRIPELYDGVRPFAGNVVEGSSVLARYPADGVLYRATVICFLPYSQYIVHYIDFGNRQLVEAKDIWQLDRELMGLPKMAVLCSLLGVAPKDGEWESTSEIDLCFTALKHQCIFQEFAEDNFRVSLWNNGHSVADTLVEKNLAIRTGPPLNAVLKDESIDVTLIIGQQMLCKVTHVESHEKFFVQLDIDKARIVEKTIANFDTNMLTPLDVDSIAKDVYCALKHEGKLYRAKLCNVSDLSAIKATLLDYGYTITTSKENVMIPPTKFGFYYQTFESRFHNYTIESKKLMNLDELKEKLNNKKFIVIINDFEGLSLVTTLYELGTGAKVCVFSSDEVALDKVSPLCPRSVLNRNIGVAFVSHMESLNEIYLQKSSDTDKLAAMLKKLYTFYEEGTTQELENLETDALCAAKSSGGYWYRAIIISFTETCVKVQFPDYGKSETISRNSIKKLDPKFFEPCSFGLVVGLGLVALKQNALDTLKKWTLKKKIHVTVAIGVDGWLANLHVDGVDLSLKLVNEKLAAPQLTSKEEENNIEESVSLPEGTA